MKETFTVKLHIDKASGGGKIYFKKDQFEFLINTMGFPLKKEMKAVCDSDTGEVILTKL